MGGVFLRAAAVVLVLACGVVHTAATAAAGTPPRLAWVKHVGACDGGGVAALPDGGFLVCGAFWGTTTFGQGEAEETTLRSGGQRDIFLARYRGDGTLVWARRAGGSGDDMANAVAATPDGDALITGKFFGTAAFGFGGGGVRAITAAGKYDVFVARYRSDGSCAWAARAGGPRWDQGTGIAATPDGGALVAGYYWDAATFGAGEKDQSDLPADGPKGYFLARYRPDGTLAWAKRPLGRSEENEMATHANVLALPDGSLALSGGFLRNKVVGQGEPGQASFRYPGGGLFVARYGLDGILRRAVAAGGDQWAYCSGMAAWPNGELLVGGRFRGSLTFGSPPAAVATLTAHPPWRQDVFLARYRPDGSLAWARRVGGDDIDFGAGVAALPNGGAVLAGTFRSIATFGLGERDPVRLVAEGEDDAFLACYSAAGSLAWAAPAGGVGRDTGDAVAGLADSSVVLMGHFEGTAAFGGDGPGATDLNAVSELGDLFLARFEPLAAGAPGR